MANSSRLDDQRRRLYALKRAPALRHTSNTVLLQLLDEAQEVSWDKGTVVCEEDQDSKGFFLLLDGELEVRRGDELLLTLRPGTPLGVEALVSGRSAVTARAVMPSRGLFFPKEQVWELVSSRAGLRQDLGHLTLGAPRGRSSSARRRWSPSRVMWGTRRSPRSSSWWPRPSPSTSRTGCCSCARGRRRVSRPSPRAPTASSAPRCPGPPRERRAGWRWR
ncbi:cyclic nucleotide-binding domain-containing protein, partial [Pyxidicoccus sp. 3LG]